MIGMRTRRAPLLAELHSHTTWSDGALTVTELVDLVGTRGFDVLCITDHVLRCDDPWLDASERRERGVPRDRYEEYLAEIVHEAVRARALYDLLVIPGLELTYNDVDPGRAAHAVSIGLREHVSVDGGIDEAVRAATRVGAAVVAAHPYSGEPAAHRSRLTQRWAVDAELRQLTHRFELFNRNQLFGWIAEAGLPCLATGDVHVPAHLAGWKTLLPCGKDEDSVIAYLRSPRPVYLARVDEIPDRLAA
jgi:predicted metal-dependent phosphoesterase TrpH